MKRILILFAHPALEKSRINARFWDGLSEIEGVTVHDLYEVYPELDIDVVQEQALLNEHDIIIFHHPLFWYSTPAILKEWQDLVLEHGWAYGSRGNQLEGKVFFNIITAGGKQDAYRPDGYNQHTIRQLLAPIEQTCRLCRMEFLPPFVFFGTHSIRPDEVDSHKNALYRILAELRDGRLETERAVDLPCLNELELS